MFLNCPYGKKKNNNLWIKIVEQTKKNNTHVHAVPQHPFRMSLCHVCVSHVVVTVLAHCAKCLAHPANCLVCFEQVSLELILATASHIPVTVSNRVHILAIASSQNRSCNLSSAFRPKSRHISVTVEVHPGQLVKPSLGLSSKCLAHRNTCRAESDDCKAHSGPRLVPAYSGNCLARRNKWRIFTTRRRVSTLDDISKNGHVNSAHRLGIPEVEDSGGR